MLDSGKSSTSDTPLLINALGTSVGIYCQNPECNTLAAVVIDEQLIIQHRHHGEKHLTVINLKAAASAILFGT